MSPQRCSICGTTGEIKPINGSLPDHPSGWATVMVSALPVKTSLLCPTCLERVQRLLRGEAA